jgi:hypothetical protein
MNLRDVKLSSRAVIPVALAIPMAPVRTPHRPHPREAHKADEDVQPSANCPHYWL